ncbi:hypothetical protein PoB_002927900 [Plakobranchus ocellatus]|uniref:Uncharacterized protein n=1 Tax=Plakobranchus ocellatus TaxID=259542 RepID=A0AAV4A960_9GAST|nr:hypothetical protein PoB_002927900 [Plakobranchus ocellatus]
MFRSMLPYLPEGARPSPLCPVYVRVVTLQGYASQVIPGALGAVRRLVPPQPSVYGPMNNAAGRKLPP